MVAKVHAEVVRWQRALETVIHKIIEKEMLERDLGIKFTEPRGCEGVGGAQF